MITQQRLRLVQQLAFVLCAGALVSSSQLRQYFDSCPLTHGFVHSSQGNSHFWRNVSFPAALTPLPGNKTFGAIRRLTFFKKPIASKVSFDIFPAPFHPFGCG